jgi:hypothetical protein
MELNDRQLRDNRIRELEYAIGEELLKLDPSLGVDPLEALASAGVWVDAPKPPKFEGVDEMVMGPRASSSGVPLAQLFPIREWTQAYEHYRYQVRIFAFSEHYDSTATAAKLAMQRKLGIASDSFYESIRRERR